MRVSSRPTIIQGGMGVAVSSWPLARAVAVAGQLGVVSGTALDIVVARRLQDGDPGGHLRRALAAFPVPEIAERVATRYFRPEGRGSGNRYAPVPPLTLPPTRRAQELTVVAHFVEVFLAKEGHDGLIGINYLEKVQLALPYGILGAMLAGVDYVMVGAGLPRQVPALLNAFAALQPASIDIDVAGSAEPHRLTVDPAHWSPGSAPLHRPAFVAIISSDILAGYLARDESTRPEGFVVEGPSAGGHNAPPRGRLTLDDEGEPVYGARDVANLERMVALGLPFWLAGSYGTPERLLEALAAGAAGIQAGTVFALCEQSGLTPGLRVAALAGLRSERLLVRTDVAASPTGFPVQGGPAPDPRPARSDTGSATSVCCVRRTPGRTTVWATAAQPSPSGTSCARAAPSTRRWTGPACATGCWPMSAWRRPGATATSRRRC